MRVAIVPKNFEKFGLETDPIFKSNVIEIIIRDFKDAIFEQYPYMTIGVLFDLSKILKEELSKFSVCELFHYGDVEDCSAIIEKHYTDKVLCPLMDNEVFKQIMESEPCCWEDKWYCEYTKVYDTIDKIVWFNQGNDTNKFARIVALTKVDIPTLQANIKIAFPSLFGNGEDLTCTTQLTFEKTLEHLLKEIKENNVAEGLLGKNDICVGGERVADTLTAWKYVVDILTEDPNAEVDCEIYYNDTDGSAYTENRGIIISKTKFYEY